LSIGSLLKPPLSRSSSTRSISVDGKAYDRAHLCDEVLAAHFSAASQGLRLEAIEERASKADQEMCKAKAELAATEAQEAMQCVMWKNMFEAEINTAKIYREKAEHAEVRWKSSKTEASQAKSEQLEVDRLRAEVVDRGAGWATERERLLDEIYELQASLASHEGRVAGFELQVQKSSEAAAMATVQQCNELEALAMVRQEAGRAHLRAEATESQRVTTEQQRIEATALAEAMKLELDMARRNEETSVALALAEARSEAVIAREARTKIAELQIEVSENETLARVQALENERRRDVEEATRMHADAQQALELLCSFVQQRESENSSKENEMSALKEFEEKILAQSKAAAVREAVAAKEAQTEATMAIAAQKHCSELRAELISQGRAQRDLHDELQALSNAAAAVRAVAAAKDETISELQATSRLMVSELAMSGSTPPAGYRKVLDEKHDRFELSRASGTSGGSTIGDGSVVTPVSVTPSDSMSQASLQTLGAQGRYRSAENAQEGPRQSSWERHGSLVDHIKSRSGSPTKAGDLVPPLHSRTPTRSLPVPFASPSRPQTLATPQPFQTPSRTTSNEEPVNPQLSQAAAFLNAAAAKAAAAASAVEAFFPFVPTTNPMTPAQGETASTNSNTGSDPPAGSSDFASKTTSSSKADTGRTQEWQTESPAKAPPQGNKSWEEAQAVMTEQIRNDILLLRKALSDTGMRGSPLEDEVEALERQTEAKLGHPQPKDPDTSPTASRASTIDKKIPQAIKNANSKANVRRLSPPGGCGRKSSFGGSPLAGSFSTKSAASQGGQASQGGSLRFNRSPERSQRSSTPLVKRQESSGKPDGAEGGSVHIPIAEVVTGSGQSGSICARPGIARQPSLEGSFRTPIARGPFMAVPQAEVRTSSVTKSRETGGVKLMASASEVALGPSREPSAGSMIHSASEMSMGHHQWTQIKASSLGATAGPARGVVVEVQADRSGSVGLLPPRSISPGNTRQSPWLAVRSGSQTSVSRMVSLPTRHQSPTHTRLRSQEGNGQIG
jgi:hypothetical protein